MPFPITSVTNTEITVGSTSTNVLTGNSARLLATFVNNSDEDIYISFGGTAVQNAGIRLNANGGLYEIGQSNLYVGLVSAICTSGGKSLTVIYANK